MKAYLVRGVPMRMQQDGWWLNSPEPTESGDRTARRPVLWRAGALVALLALGDALFWGVLPGLALAVFAMACVAVAVLLVWPGLQRERLFLAAGLTVLSVLPVVELVQPLSLIFLFLGIPLVVLILSGRPLQLWLRAIWRFWLFGPIHSLVESISLADGLVGASPSADTGRFFNGWALPVGVGAVFTALLVEANPVAAHWLINWKLDLPDVSRVMMWTGLALIIWPVLSAQAFGPVLAPDRKSRRPRPRRTSRLINADSILRSLVLFNLLFAGQNAMDMAFLAGGVSLPDGLTYAEYAHRGAYPLLILALLSGAFALLARPFITLAPVVRTLLLIWVAQTIWLTCSSFLRLDLYVEVYGLTRLRIAAGLWMAMVAAGLVMILWQIAKAQSNRWLLLRVASLGAAVLYGCCFFSFDRAIAQYNLTHDVPRDWIYLRFLGEGAAPVFVEQSVPRQLHPTISIPADWREWGFRNARVRASLAALNEQAKLP